MPLAVTDVSEFDDRERLAPREPRTDRVCAACGYGVAAPRAPVRCPMCGGEAWVAPAPRDRRPLAA